MSRNVDFRFTKKKKLKKKAIPVPSKLYIRQVIFGFMHSESTCRSDK